MDIIVLDNTKSVIPIENSLEIVTLSTDKSIVENDEDLTVVTLCGNVIRQDDLGFIYDAHYGDATPALMLSIPDNYFLDRIEVDVLTPFTSGSALEIGTLLDSNKYFETIDTDLTALVSYEKTFSDLGPIDLYLTLYPISGEVSGHVRIQIFYYQEI